MRIGKPKALLLFCLLCCALFNEQTAVAQSVNDKPPTSGDARRPESLRPDVLRLNTSLVLVDAAVVSKRTRAIVGDLRQEDFTLYDNGQAQPITHFSREELPLSVVLLLDVSNSVHSVIEKIRDTAQDALTRLKPDDRVAVMLFATRAKLTAGLTTDRALIADKLADFGDSVQEVGADDTIIGAGVYDAARYLRQHTAASERRAIILITDDEDFGYNSPPQGVVLRELSEGGTTLCALVVNPRGGSRTKAALGVGATAVLTAVNPISGAFMLGSQLLRRSKRRPSTARFFSDHTGGVLLTTKQEDVARLFTEVVALLRTRYTFGYVMPDGLPDQQFRAIKVAVSERAGQPHGGVAVLARRGYYPDTDQVAPETPTALPKTP